MENEVQIDTSDEWKTPSSKRIVKGGMILTIVNIISSLFFTAFNMTLSQWNNLQDASMLFIIDNWRLFFYYIAALGFVGGGSKFLSEYLVRDKKEARIYAKSASKYNFLFIGFPFLGLTILLAITVPQTPQQQVAYFFLIFIVLFDRLRSCSDIYLLGYQRYDYYAVALYGPDIFAYSFGILTLFWFGFIGPVFCWVFSNALGFILSMYFVSRVSDFPLSDVFDWRKEYGLAGKMIRFNLLFSLANVIFALLTTRLLLVIGGPLGLLTNEEIIALGLVSTYGNLLINTFQIVSPILQSISEAHSLKNPKLIENYTLLSLKFPIILSVAVISFFILFGPDIISIFNGVRWMTIGIFIITVIFFSYTIAAFSSKYDNILAGIGKPGVPMTPWIVGFALGMFGIFMMFILPKFYVVNSFFLVNGVLVNFGLRFNFIVGSIIYYSSLIVSGIWIIALTFKVLKVSFPKDYLYKPIIAASITCAFLFLINVFLRDFLITLIGDMVFVVIMIVIGVLIYLIVGCLIGAITIEDGLLWSEVFFGMGLKYPLYLIFWIGKQALRLRARFKSENHYKWILKVNNEIIKENQLFSVIVNIDKKEIKKNEKVIITFTIKDFKKKFYNFLNFIKINSIILKNKAIYMKEIESVQSQEIEFAIPEKINEGLHEIRVCFELFDELREFYDGEKDVTKEKQLNSGLWTWFDYRMKWYHEKVFRIKIKKMEKL
ncbi:MAG: hypothetical protein ACTSX4_01435 [Candidatus Helarchaeota archaeon]